MEQFTINNKGVALRETDLPVISDYDNATDWSKALARHNQNNELAVTGYSKDSNISSFGNLNNKVVEGEVINGSVFVRRIIRNVKTITV